MNLKRDIQYVERESGPLALDLYLPDDRPEPTPVVIWIHGGAFRHGSRADVGPARRQVERGYAVASVDYRLSGTATFPAQIRDCKAAVRWVRANAGAYALDADRIAAWGASAGGHLAALVGTTGDDASFGEPDDYPDHSAAVRAVCDYFGPTDFLSMNEAGSEQDHEAPDSPESELIGGPIHEHPDRVERADPATYVDGDEPPFLIVHGSEDPIVPHDQSVSLRDALRDAGSPVSLHTVAGAGHGGFEDPDVDRLVDDFFDEQIGRE
ncbi:alpha/beta hydrolase fold domain-containing protein [Halosimplex sp. J119]